MYLRCMVHRVPTHAHNAVAAIAAVIETELGGHAGGTGRDLQGDGVTGTAVRADIEGTRGSEDGQCRQ